MAGANGCEKRLIYFPQRLDGWIVLGKVEHKRRGVDACDHASDNRLTLAVA